MGAEHRNSRAAGQSEPIEVYLAFRHVICTIIFLVVDGAARLPTSGFYMTLAGR